MRGHGWWLSNPPGREKLHFLNPEPINAIADRWMTQYDRARATPLADVKHALEQRTMDNCFVYTTYIKTSADQLWTALTEPAFVKRYWGVELASAWKVGSSVTWEVAGVTIADEEQVVLASDPPRRLSYTWRTITPEFLAAIGDDEEISLKSSDRASIEDQLRDRTPR